MGYPGALGIDLSAEAGNFPAILKKVEQAVVAKGGKGRFGTWAFSYGFTVTAGLGEFAMRVVERQGQEGQPAGPVRRLRQVHPGRQVERGLLHRHGHRACGPRTTILVYMDTYIFGKGFLPTTAQKVPEKYFQIKFQRSRDPGFRSARPSAAAARAALASFRGPHGAGRLALLSFEHVSKDFYGNVVLHDVCFDLRPGEILGLVGENGAGKTTLMRILFGMPVIAETGGLRGPGLHRRRGGRASRAPSTPWTRASAWCTRSSA